tara:strand:- start:246 stop:2579 length:2334 start_codon:yes stop_codon:yes gene_type:complete
MKTTLLTTISLAFALTLPASAQDGPSAASFLAEAQKVLPEEKPYDYHKALAKGPVHTLLRDAAAKAADNELAVDGNGWTLLTVEGAGPAVTFAVGDMQEFMKASMGVEIEVEWVSSFADSDDRKKVILAGTKAQFPGFDAEFKTGKDYAIRVTGDRIVVCGEGERGVMFGLFDLESRMGLRGGPFLANDLDTVRHSLYQNRMAISWLGWMQWPDALLSHIAHDGFDAIFTSVYANPNGLKGPPHYDIIREQTPERLNDVIDRAHAHGLKVYTPMLFANTREEQNKQELREHVRDIVTKFPGIKGYVLLTEGFYYEKFFGAGGHGKQNLNEWAEYWTDAVKIVTEEAHKIDPDIEILPWEYNIDFRPHRVELKRHVTSLLPKDSIPLLTWENGKGFELDGLHGYLRDYSISQVGPAEVAAGQIEMADSRGMDVYCKVDCFATWQFGTTPYIPAPQQWQKRYDKLAEYGVDGTLETWSNGYKPNFIADLRAWSCWTDPLDQDTLLNSLARRQFGSGTEETVLAAWSDFSDAIQNVPDTGPSMGTNSSVSMPLFFEDPPSRVMTLHNSWWDDGQKGHWRHRTIPYWPFAHQIMVFKADFSNRRNASEAYARKRSGIGSLDTHPVAADVAVLPVFDKYLGLAADGFEKGLKKYRQAALDSPPEKRETAFKEVLPVEQMQRMLRSTRAILEFEDLRFQLKGKTPPPAAEQEKMLDRLAEILEEEIVRTAAAAATARLDSRLGYESEMDYVYTPFVLEQKLWVLKNALENELPDYRASLGDAR